MPALNARDCPVLDVGALARVGLLEAADGTKWLWSCRTLNDPLTHFDVKLQVCRVEGGVAIIVLTAEDEELQLIPVDYVCDSKGRSRWAFLLDDEPAYKLFFARGRFETGKTHGLRYSNTRQPQADSRKLVRISLVKAAERPHPSGASSGMSDAGARAGSAEVATSPEFSDVAIASDNRKRPLDRVKGPAYILENTFPAVVGFGRKTQDESSASRPAGVIANDGSRPSALDESVHSRCAEDHVAIRIERLQKWGLLGNEPGGIAVDLPTRKGPERIIVAWDPVRSSLTLTGRSSRSKWDVEVSSRGPSGRKCVRFVCPMLAVRCTDLYFVAGRLGSREAFGLSYYSERLGPRQRLGLKRRMGGAPQRFAPHEVELIEAAAPSEATPGAQCDLYGTKTALRQASIVDAATFKRAQFLMDARSSTLKAEALVNPLSLSSLTSRHELSLFELQPRLEMGALRRAGLLVEGELRSAFTMWSCERVGLDHAFLYVDLRDPQFRFLAIRSVFGKDCWDQLVRISPALARPADRRFFLCPVVGEKVETLAWRAGRWASREPQRLRNSSQRSERFYKQIQLGERGEWGAEGL